MNIYWKGTVPSGSFTSAGNWVQSSVPGISDIAELTTGATVTVSTGAPVTVLGVNLALGALLINTDFTATEGTAIGSNKGTIEVNNGAQFSVGGAVKNVNTINVNSGKLAVDDFDLTVNGGGLIGLGGSGATLVVSAGRTLVNFDNTIAPEIFREGGLHQCPFRVSKRTMVWLVRDELAQSATSLTFIPRTNNASDTVATIALAVLRLH